MAVYDAVFWERTNSDGLFAFLKAYNLTVIRIKPPVREALTDFLSKNATGVIFTDRPKELVKVDTDALIVAILENQTDEDYFYADLVLERKVVSNISVSKEMSSKILRLINKARILAESKYRRDREDDTSDEHFTLSVREKELYDILKTYPNGLSSTQLSSMLGWKPNMLRVYILRLKNKGYDVAQISGKYRLVK